MPAIKEAGDSALLLELEPVIDPAVNARAIAIAAAVREDVIPGVRDVIPTYRSVAVHFDPLITDARDVVASLERAADAPVVPVAMLADDSRDDLVVVGEVTRASAVSPHVRDQLVRVQTFRLGERGPKHSGHHDLVRGLERDRERILKHATAGRRGSWERLHLN